MHRTRMARPTLGSAILTSPPMRGHLLRLHHLRPPTEDGVRTHAVSNKQLVDKHCAQSNYVRSPPQSLVLSGNQLSGGFDALAALGNLHTLGAADNPRANPLPPPPAAA